MNILVLVKKTITLCALALGTYVTGNAQAFEVRHNGALLQDGTEMEIKEYDTANGETTLTFAVDVKNVSGAERSMRMIKEEVLLVPNTKNDMCWDLCVDGPEAEGTLADGGTAHPYATFKLNEGGGNPATGTSTIRYTFKSRTKGDPAITVTVKYTYEEQEEPGEKPEEPGEKPVEPVEPPVTIEDKFEVRHNGTLLEDGAEVIIKEYETVNGETHMKFNVDVTNISDASLSMRMIKDVRSAMANTVNTMCWDVCVDPSSLEATCETLLSGEVSHPYADLTLNESGSKPATGTSIIYYTFKTRTKADPTVTVKVNYTYEAPTGIEEVIPKEAFIVTQPAGEQKFNVSTSLDGNTSARLDITDFSGRIMQTLPILPGSGNVTTTKVLAKGYYLLILKRGSDVVGVRKGMIR